MDILFIHPQIMKKIKVFAIVASVYYSSFYHDLVKGSNRHDLGIDEGKGWWTVKKIDKKRRIVYGEHITKDGAKWTTECMIPETQELPKKGDVFRKRRFFVNRPIFTSGPWFYVGYEGKYIRLTTMGGTHSFLVKAKKKPPEGTFVKVKIPKKTKEDFKDKIAERNLSTFEFLQAVELTREKYKKEIEVETYVPVTPKRGNDPKYGKYYGIRWQHDAGLPNPLLTTHMDYPTLNGWKILDIDWPQTLQYFGGPVLKSSKEFNKNLLEECEHSFAESGEILKEIVLRPLGEVGVDVHKRYMEKYFSEENIHAMEAFQQRNILERVYNLKEATLALNFGNPLDCNELLHTKKYQSHHRLLAPDHLIEFYYLVQGITIRIKEVLLPYLKKIHHINFTGGGFSVYAPYESATIKILTEKALIDPMANQFERPQRLPGSSKVSHLQGCVMMDPDHASWLLFKLSNPCFYALRTKNQKIPGNFQTCSQCGTKNFVEEAMCKNCRKLLKGFRDIVDVEQRIKKCAMLLKPDSKENRRFVAMRICQERGWDPRFGKFLLMGSTIEEIAGIMNINPKVARGQAEKFWEIWRNMSELQWWGYMSELREKMFPEISCWNIFFKKEVKK